MARFTYVVFTQPVPGRDDDYNAWYTDEHVPDILRVEGFVSAQRFKRVDVEGNAPGASPYMAIYELEGDDPAVVLGRLMEVARNNGMIMSDAFDMTSAKTILYQPITGRIVEG